MFFYVLLLLLIILVSGSLSSRINCNEFMRLEETASLKTGDLIFTRHKNFASRMQQWALGSPINHVAMIVRIEKELWVFDVDPPIGAYLTTFADFVKSNFDGTHKKPKVPKSFYGLDIPYIVPRVSYAKSALYVKQMNGKVDDVHVLDFVQKNIGRPFSFRFWCAASSLALSFDLPCHFMQEGDGMFCSEILYTLFLELGIVPARNPRTVLPLHFWENGVKWSPVKQLVGAIKEEEDEAVSPKIVDMILRSTPS